MVTIISATYGPVQLYAALRKNLISVFRSFLTAHQHILGYSVPFIHSVLFTVW